MKMHLRVASLTSIMPIVSPLLSQFRGFCDQAVWMLRSTISTLQQWRMLAVNRMGGGNGIAAFDGRYIREKNFMTPLKQSSSFFQS